MIPFKSNYFMLLYEARLDLPGPPARTLCLQLGTYLYDAKTERRMGVYQHGGYRFVWRNSAAEGGKVLGSPMQPIPNLAAIRTLMTQADAADWGGIDDTDYIKHRSGVVIDEDFD